MSCALAELNALSLDATIADIGLWLGGGCRDRVESGLSFSCGKSMPRDRAEPEALPVVPDSPVNPLYDVVYVDVRISDNNSAAKESLNQHIDSPQNYSHSYLSGVICSLLGRLDPIPALYQNPPTILHNRKHEHHPDTQAKAHRSRCRRRYVSYYIFPRSTRSSRPILGKDKEHLLIYYHQAHSISLTPCVLQA